jgi:hypothetical protein
MVIRRIHPLRWWIALATVLMFIGIAIPLGIAIWYTRDLVGHECQALVIIQHSHLQNEKFAQAIDVWARSDGC